MKIMHKTLPLLAIMLWLLAGCVAPAPSAAPSSAAQPETLTPAADRELIIGLLHS